jgi:hypothetical protein
MASSNVLGFDRRRQWWRGSGEMMFGEGPAAIIRDVLNSWDDKYAKNEVKM